MAAIFMSFSALATDSSGLGGGVAHGIVRGRGDALALRRARLLEQVGQAPLLYVDGVHPLIEQRAAELRLLVWLGEFAREGLDELIPHRVRNDVRMRGIDVMEEHEMPEEQLGVSGHYRG